MKNLILFCIIFFSMTSYSQTSAYSTPRQYNKYQETTDFELLERVLSTKQKQYDKNIEKVLDKTSNIRKLIDRIYEKQNKKLSDSQKKYINSYYDYVESITKDDLSSDSKTYSIIKTLDGVEDQLYKLL